MYGTNEIVQLILATGAVGTAAMGITEGFKSVKMRPIGFDVLMRELNWAQAAIKTSYGDNYESLLQSLFRNGRNKGELPRILRQSIRIGLNGNTAKSLAQAIGNTHTGQLKEIAEKVSSGEELETADKNLIGRFEVAADARIDAALSLAERAYANGIRFWAFVVAMILSLTAGYFIAPDKVTESILIGLVAVPLAPIAKDVANGFQSAAKALGSRK